MITLPIQPSQKLSGHISDFSGDTPNKVNLNEIDDEESTLKSFIDKIETGEVCVDTGKGGKSIEFNWNVINALKGFVKATEEKKK